MSSFSPYRSPGGDSRTAVDSFYGIALNGALSPGVRAIWRPQSAEYSPGTGKASGPSPVQHIGEEFLARHLTRLDSIAMKMEQIKKAHSELVKEVNGLHRADVIGSSGLEQRSVSTDSINSLGSINSEIEVELDMKITNYIKAHYDDSEKVDKMVRLRDLVGHGLRYAKEGDLGDKETHDFVVQLESLVSKATAGGG